MIDPVIGTERSTPLATGPRRGALQRIAAARRNAARMRSFSSTGGIAGGAEWPCAAGSQRHAAASAATASASATAALGSSAATRTATIAKLAQPESNDTAQRPDPPACATASRCAACAAIAASVKSAERAANPAPWSIARKSVIGPPMSGSPPR